MLSQISQLESILRGGGCGTSKIDSLQSEIIKSDGQDLYNFINKFNYYIDIVCTKAVSAADQSVNQEIMIALQWFIFQEENIHKLNKNAQSVMKSYDLILEGIRKLLKSCLIYIRTDSFKCLYILQTTASLSKVIFSFHILNEQRFMKCDLQQEFLDISDELRQHIEIEKNDLTQNQMELYLFLTKTSFEISPTNRKEREKILKGCLGGIIVSIIQMKPNEELLKSLIKGAQYLYKQHVVNQGRKQFEVYFQIDTLQWEIISYFRSDRLQNFDEIIVQIESLYEEIVKNSNEWKYHYLWVQMVGKLIQYNPLLTKHKLSQLISALNLGGKSDQIWKEYQRKGLIIQVNHSNGLAIIQLDKLQNSQLNEIDRTILETYFKEWEIFLLLKDFLINEQFQNIPFTFGSYLSSKFENFDGKALQKNENLLTMNIKRFLGVLFPSKLLTLIKQNDERLDEVIKICKSIMIDKQYNESTIFKIFQQQIKRIIQNLEDYFQNIQDIIKIMSLNQNNQKEECFNNNIDFGELNNLLRLQEKFQLFIILDERNQTKKQNGIDQDWIQQTLEELKKELSLSFLDKATIQQQKNKICEEVEKRKEIYNVEFDKIQQQKQLSLYFQNQVNNLYSYYEKMTNMLQKHFSDIERLKDFIIIKYKIEAKIEEHKKGDLENEDLDNHDLENEDLKKEDLKKIKQKFLNGDFLKQFEKQRYENLKLQLKLANSKKSFQMILQKASQKEQKQVLEDIKLEEFLLNVITNVSKRIMTENTSLDPPLHIELGNDSDEDFRQKLLEQKGVIAYHIIRQRINEKMINSERKDLELIEKELGELFIKEPPSFLCVEKIKTIFEDLKVDKQLRDGKFQLLEKDKYLSQLRQIENLSKIQSIQKKNWNLLIIQTETVIKTISTFGQTYKEIDQMLVNQELLILQSIICKLSEQEQQQASKSQDPTNENYRTYLQFMIKIVKQKTLSLHEVMELLNQLFEKVVLFYGKLDQIQRYEKDDQAKFQKCFQECIQECIINFEKSQTQLFKREKDKMIAQYQVKISDFLKQLVFPVKENLVELKFRLSTPFKQNFLIQQIKKIYLEDIEEDDEEEQKEKIGLLDNLVQRFKYFANYEQWKIKQGLVFTIIQISSNCFSTSITSFCQKVLIQLWIQEKDQRVRNILKNKELISMQMQILQKDWQTQHDRIASKMQEMLRRIDELQEQISHEANLNKRDIYLKELDETTEQLDQQIENITEMGQQLRLLTDFVNHIRKGLIRVEGKINEMKEQLKSMGNDIKLLRGKSVEQLFEIRKWKVLKEAALKNAKSIYIPLDTKEISHKCENLEDKLSILINFEQIDDTNGEVNKFLFEQKETVLLIHGVAGSGKSTTAKKIEEFIWKLHNNNKNIRNQILIPVYISLPSLKNPVFQAVEEALHQDEYGFDELQLRECKEMLEKKEFRLLLIMDSYDEMKLENIQKNLYMNNKVKQNWSDPLVIFTTRSEIFTSSNYAFWFAPEKKENLKEIQIQKFHLIKIQEYLKKFTIQSIKMLIFEKYEWQTQISNRGGVDVNHFEMGWEKLQEQCLNLEPNGEALLNQNQIENILQFLKDNQFFTLKSNEVLRSLMVKLQKLWSVEKYKKIMEQINLYRLIETPYMMEIVVQVLPKMMMKASEIINLKLNFLKNFPNMLYEFYKSNYLIQMYNWQKKKYIQQDKNEEEQQENNEEEQQDNNEEEQQDNNEEEQQDNNEEEQQDKNDNNEKEQLDNNEKEKQDNYANNEKKQQDDNDNNENEQQDKNDNNEKEQLDNIEKEQKDNNENQQQVTQADVENLDKINYFEIAVEVWNKMEEDSVAIQLFKLEELDDLNNKKNLLFEHYLKLFNNAFAKINIQKDKLIEVVYNALCELNLTSYDFYDEFINQYHYQQIEKQRNLGKSIHIDRFLHDLKKYSINLAKVMSTKQMTQVQYQQQGFLYQEEKEEEKWQNEFFNDDDRQFGSYKKDLRSCSLVQQKGTNFQFVHKSIQEFYIAADVYAVLALSKDLQKKTFDWILDKLSKEKNYDNNVFQYLLIQMNQEDLIKFNVQVFDRQQKVAFKQSIEQTLILLRTLNKHEFFKENYSSETYAETRKYLIQKIKQQTQIIEFLKFLVYLTAYDTTFIQGGSNSLNLLVEMKVDLKYHNFSKRVGKAAPVLSFSQRNDSSKYGWC